MATSELQRQRDLLARRRAQLEQYRPTSPAELQRKNLALQQVARGEAEIQQFQQEQEAFERQRQEQERLREETVGRQDAIQKAIEQGVRGRAVTVDLSREERAFVNEQIEKIQSGQVSIGGQLIPAELAESSYLAAARDFQRLQEQPAQQLPSIQAQGQMGITGTTALEQQLQMSLPSPIRNLPPQAGRNVLAGKSEILSVPMSTKFGEGINVVPVKPESFNIFKAGAKAEELILGKGTKLLDKGLERVFPTKTKIIEVPERRFMERGTGVFDPITGKVTTPMTFTESKEIKEFSLAKALLGAKIKVVPGTLAVSAFFAPAFSTGTQAVLESEFVEVSVFNKATGQFERKIVSKAEANRLAKESLADILSDKRIGTDVKIVKDLSIRDITRKEILKNIENPKKLKQLREFYKKVGREGLFDDILRQEVGPKTMAAPEIQKIGGVSGPLPPPVSFKTDLIDSKTRTMDLPKAEESAFFGTGTYERTTDKSFKTLARPVSDKLFTSKAQIDFLKGDQTTLQKSLSKQQQRQRELLGLSQSSVQRSQQAMGQEQPQRARQPALSIVALRSSLREAQQQRLRQKQLQLQRPGSSEATTIKRPPTTRIVPESGDISALKSALKKISKAKAYDVYLQRGGKFRKIADDLPIGVALKTGSDASLESLGAQFKVVPDPNKKPKIKKDIRFVPSLKEFRNYKIVAGKKQPLPLGHFIEHKNRRITSGGEIKEILKYQSKARIARGGTRSKRTSKLMSI